MNATVLVLVFVANVAAIRIAIEERRGLTLLGWSLGVVSHGGQR